MPSWNIHISIANKLNKKLKLDKNSFYIGVTLPDVDNTMNIKKNETHYYNIKHNKFSDILLPNFNDFLNDYKNKLNNPIVIGMYVHLLTDYFYNNEIINKYYLKNNDNFFIKLLNGKETSEIKKNKHLDLELYGKYLFKYNNIILPNFDNNVLKNLNELNIKDFSEVFIKKRINYINTKYLNKNICTLKERIVGLKYKIFTKEELDYLYNECIKFIEKEIKRIRKE